MSDLRSRISSARGQYESLHYPGLLSDDIVARQRRRHRAWGLLTGAVAAAAMIAIAIFLYQPGQTDLPEGPGHGGIIATSQPGTSTEHTSTSSGIAFLPEHQDTLAPEVPSWPSDMSFTPAGQSLLAPSMPSFWSSTDDSGSTDTPTTREAV